MSTRTKRPKKTAELGQTLDEKLRGKGVKVRHVNTAKVGGSMVSFTDGRSSASNYKLGETRNQDYRRGEGYTSDSTTSKNGRLAVAKRDESGRLLGTDTKNAETNFYTEVNADGTKKQSGQRYIGKNKDGKKQYSTMGNRRQRDYITRVGLNNDQRSDEALSRLADTLRSMGASEDEIAALTRRDDASRVSTG